MVGRGGSGEPGRKGSANIVTAGYGNYLRSCRRSPLQAPGRLPGSLTVPGLEGLPDCYTRQPSLISFRSCDGGRGGSCPLLTFYSSFPEDGILIKQTSREASAPGRLPLLQADVRREPFFYAPTPPLGCSIFVASLLTSFLR